MTDIRSIEPARVAGRLGQRILDTARHAVDRDIDIVAYAIVALCADGTPFVGTGCNWPDEYPCNRHMFVGMATELIRDDMIVDEAARSVVNRANGYEDD